MTLPRTIRRREKRKRAKARKLAPVARMGADLALFDSAYKAAYEDFVSEELKPNPLFRLFRA